MRLSCSGEGRSFSAGGMIGVPETDLCCVWPPGDAAAPAVGGDPDEVGRVGDMESLVGILEGGGRGAGG
jgi:hypothetical protein